MNSEIPDLPFSPITALESPNATPDAISDLPAEVPNVSSSSPEPIAGPSSAPSDDRPVLDWQLVPGSRSQRVFSRYRRTEVRYVFNFGHNITRYPNLWEIRDEMDRFYVEFVKANTSEFSPNDLISIEIDHENLTKPIFVPPFRLDNFEHKIQSFFNALYEVSQSNTTFMINGRLRIKLNRTEEILGSARAPKTIDQIMKRKLSVVTIVNKVAGRESDNGCAFHALAVCLAALEKKNKLSELKDKNLLTDVKKKKIESDYTSIRRSVTKRVVVAKRLAVKCKMSLDKAISLDDFDKIQRFLDHQIIVLDSLDVKNVIYRGNEKKGQKVGQLYLLYRGNEFENNRHYDAIVNPKGLIGGSYFCPHCVKTFEQLTSHMCSKCCERCQSFPPCAKNETPVKCPDCRFSFFGMNCMRAHKKGENSYCNNLKFCPNCEDSYSKDNHECRKNFCVKCRISYEKCTRHFCTVRKLKYDQIVEEDKCNKIIIAYDIECYQDPSGENSFNHVPDLLIARSACDECWNQESLNRPVTCSVCGDSVKVYSEGNVIKQFCDDIYALANEVAPKISLYVYAHNAKGYDNNFVLNDLYGRSFKGISVIMSGNKILNAKVGNVSYLDTLMIFQQSLASLPKAFGLQDRVVKGFFPHMFHTSANLSYNGPLPDKSCFSPEYMKLGLRNEFNEWYDSESLKFDRNPELKYNLKNELIKYCRNDVDILLYCIQSFRTSYKIVTGIDPITRVFTLASMGMEFYRAKVMPDYQLGITPVEGYASKRKASKQGNLWLDWEQYKTRVGHEHDNSVREIVIDREVMVGTKYVDGYEQLSSTAYEFNGCFWHGHQCSLNQKYSSEESTEPAPLLKLLLSNTSKSVPQKRQATTIDLCAPSTSKIRRVNEPLTRDTPIPKLSNRSLNQARLDTLEKERMLLKLVPNVITKWECDWNDEKLQPEVKKYLAKRRKELNLLADHGGVNIRQSFFGGRTNNLRFWFNIEADIDRDTQILYYDFRSLYPTVLKYKPFPSDHPEVLNENLSKDMSSYFGFAKCIVKPPNQLYIPVLPYRNRAGKLLFPLCRTCADEKNNLSCAHNDCDRNLIGTWTTIELEEAVKRGYEISEVIEVYNYRTSATHFFREYINIWLKIKQESDGWPSWVQTEEDKDKYIDDFEAREGIRLDREKIVKNPALRFIAKLFLNTLWGKLAQRPNQTQTYVCNTVNDYWKLAKDEEKLVTGELMVNEDTLIMSYKHKSEETCDPRNTSLAISSFVTSWARLMLLDVINEIQSQAPYNEVLYFDTDSVIFKHKRHDINGDLVPKPSVGDYLGDLCDEISKDHGPDAVCTNFVSLAPKVYALEVKKPGESESHVSIKVKGISLNAKTMDKITFDSMLNLAKDFSDKSGDLSTAQQILVDQMQIRPSKLQTIETKFFEKTFRATSDKRRIVAMNQTLPYGYKEVVSTTTIVRAE